MELYDYYLEKMKTIFEKDLKEKYEVVEDYQGGEFAIGIWTVEELIEMTANWLDSDGSYETLASIPQCFEAKMNVKEFIEWISDFWEIEIEKCDKKCNYTSEEKQELMLEALGLKEGNVIEFKNPIINTSGKRVYLFKIVKIVEEYYLLDLNNENPPSYYNIERLIHNTYQVHKTKEDYDRIVSETVKFGDLHCGCKYKESRLCDYCPLRYLACSSGTTPKETFEHLKKDYPEEIDKIIIEEDIESKLDTTVDKKDI